MAKAVRRKRIVCIGGGTGQAQLLRGLSEHDAEITAIVGVTDNGGHSGELRRIFGVPQMGDIRNCLASLADESRLLTQLLKYRFSEGALDGASLGNLVVCGLMRMRGSLSSAIDALRQELGIAHRIVPVSDHSAQVCAELADGRIVRGEWEIMMREPRQAVMRLFHEPEIPCLPECAVAIAHADVIVFCPGSLLTGIVSVLLAQGIRTAIRVSRARKVQVCNIMTQPGQTDGMAASDHLEMLSRHLGVTPDVFLVNTARPPEALLRLYREDGSEPVKADVKSMKGLKVVAKNFLEPGGKDVLTLYARSGKGLLAGKHFIRHDPAKLADVIVSL
jgi:uncharacterized cofD-like protein